MQSEQCEATTTPNFLPGYATVDDFSSALISRLVNATKAAKGLPQKEDHAYFKNFRPFRAKIDRISERIAKSTKDIAGWIEPMTKIPKENFHDKDFGDTFPVIVDCVDALLENADTILDDAKGLRDKKIATVVVTPRHSARGSRPSQDQDKARTRPQTQYQLAVDNSNTPFVPKLPNKPNAISPLNEPTSSLPAELLSHIRALGVSNANLHSAAHPYQSEIEALQFRDDQFGPVEERKYASLEETPFTWVESVEQLQSVAKKLDAASEIAIDLEHHDFRSFQGLVCLMQISTRDEDFIIDPFPLRAHLHILNSSFTNPGTVKVLHGSDSDIIWMQRDFGLYIVNMFDTGQAARILSYPSFSLSYLLNHLCGINVQATKKKYQVADWRVRPIPADMLKYAREDTHYLLYIYDRLRNDLHKKGLHTSSSENPMVSVLNRSRQLCLRRYEKEIFQSDAYLALYNRYNIPLNPVQLRVFARLFEWRDQTARRIDESHRYVLPNHLLFNVAEVMPTDQKTLFLSCSPVPPAVRQQSGEILEIICSIKKDAEDAAASAVAQPVLPPSAVHTRFVEVSAAGATIPSPVTAGASVAALKAKTSQVSVRLTAATSGLFGAPAGSDSDSESPDRPHHAGHVALTRATTSALFSHVSALTTTGGDVNGLVTSSPATLVSAATIGLFGQPQQLHGPDVATQEMTAPSMDRRGATGLAEEAVCNVGPSQGSTETPVPQTGTQTVTETVTQPGSVSSRDQSCPLSRDNIAEPVLSSRDAAVPDPTSTHMPVTHHVPPATLDRPSPARCVAPTAPTGAFFGATVGLASDLDSDSEGDDGAARKAMDIMRSLGGAFSSIATMSFEQLSSKATSSRHDEVKYLVGTNIQVATQRTPATVATPKPPQPPPEPLVGPANDAAHSQTASNDKPASLSAKYGLSRRKRSRAASASAEPAEAGPPELINGAQSDADSGSTSDTAAVDPSESPSPANKKTGSPRGQSASSSAPLSRFQTGVQNPSATSSETKGKRKVPPKYEYGNCFKPYEYPAAAPKTSPAPPAPEQQPPSHKRKTHFNPIGELNSNLEKNAFASSSQNRRLGANLKPSSGSRSMTFPSHPKKK